ncbi:Pvc16 family protein [Microbulbifer sp. SAOS-129_SWC]|uniref:Pvc16 family protein n=1 Tax=Microbulbifer sp. SAOS-129_SWC TaxID=3145235 RepID=UPI003217DAD3
MAVTQLSQVTASLETLLAANIERRLGGVLTINTSAVSPLDASPVTNLVNIYLYHLYPEGKPDPTEEPAISPSRPAFFSKPLTLHYHLTAYQASGGLTHLTEQDLLGHALATLLDHPELDDALAIGPVAVFDEALVGADNRFEIEVVVKTDSEALNVWPAYDGGSVRPSLYFKVKNVRLQPEVPPALSGPILTVGDAAQPNMGPRLLRVTSTITASLPGADGSVPRQFTRTPAELFLGAGPDDRTLLLRGTGIDRFADIELTVPVGDAMETFRINFEANAANGWAIDDAHGEVRVTAGTVVARPVAGMMQPLSLEPGDAQIRVLSSAPGAQYGESTSIEIPSKRLPFTLNPHIAQADQVAGRHFRLDLDGDFDLETMAPADNHASFLQLALGGALYHVRDSAAALEAGEAAIAGPRRIDYVLFDEADAQVPAYVQLWIRNAVSQPFWVGGA